MDRPGHGSAPHKVGSTAVTAVAQESIRSLLPLCTRGSSGAPLRRRQNQFGGSSHMEVRPGGKKWIGIKGTIACPPTRHFPSICYQVVDGDGLWESNSELPPSRCLACTLFKPKLLRIQNNLKYCWPSWVLPHLPADPDGIIHI